MTDIEINNIKSFSQIRQIYHTNSLHELTVDKLLECHRQCIAIANISTVDVPAGNKFTATKIAEVINFELNAKLTLESQYLIKRQIEELEKNTDVSVTQLEIAKAMVAEAKATSAEAKATTKLSAIIVSLTVVLAVETYYLDIPEIIKMGLVKAILPLVLFGLFLACLNWHLNRRDKKSKQQ